MIYRVQNFADHSRVLPACVNYLLLGIFFKTNVSQSFAKLIPYYLLVKKQEIVVIFYQIC